jgi:hypothetical protein
VTLGFDYDSARRTTKLLTLTVKDIPRGATVTATCSRCSRKRFVKRNARATVSLKSMIAKRLRVGTVITVVVTRPGQIAAVKRLTIRSRRKPAVVTRCLPPGVARPQVCT